MTRQDSSYKENTLPSYCEECGEELEIMDRSELEATVKDEVEWPISIPMSVGVTVDEDISHHIKKELPFAVNPFYEDGYWADAPLGRVEFTIEISKEGSYSIKNVHFE